MEEESDREIMQITARFLAEQEAGRQPRLEDYVRCYPQYADEIANFVAYYSALEARLPDASPGVSPLSEETRVALERAWGRVMTNAPIPVSLSLLMSQQRCSLTQLARALDLSIDIVEQLAERQLDPATIPQELVQRMACVLTQSMGVVRQALGILEQPARAALAEGRMVYCLPSLVERPSASRSFAEIILTSTHLSADQKELWRVIVEREKL